MTVLLWLGLVGLGVTGVAWLLEAGEQEDDDPFELVFEGWEEPPEDAPWTIHISLGSRVERSDDDDQAGP